MKAYKPTILGFLQSVNSPKDNADAKETPRINTPIIKRRHSAPAIMVHVEIVTQSPTTLTKK